MYSAVLVVFNSQEIPCVKVSSLTDPVLQ